MARKGPHVQGLQARSPACANARNGFHLRISILAREESILGRTELLELLLRLALCSLGSEGRKPVDLANMLRISVSEITPVKRPERCAPGSAEAGTEWVIGGGKGSGDCGAEPGPGTITVGASRGVAGADGDGEADSTTHMRWDCVATSLATAWASVEEGVT